MKSQTQRDPRIGARIHEARRALALRQADLARQAGLPVTVLSRLECGLQSVSAERLAALARVLGVSADWLLGLAGGAAPAPVDGLARDTQRWGGTAQPPERRSWRSSNSP